MTLWLVPNAHEFVSPLLALWIVVGAQVKEAVGPFVAVHTAVEIEVGWLVAIGIVW